jgi:hypothetical protein
MKEKKPGLFKMEYNMRYASFLAFAAFVLYFGYSGWWIFLALIFV